MKFEINKYASALFALMVTFCGCNSKDNAENKGNVDNLPEATVKIYPQPDGLPQEVKGVNHTVYVNGQKCPVYRTEATGGGKEYGQVFPEYVYFDIEDEGAVSIVVAANYPVKNAEILPSRAGISANLSGGNVISFKITKAGQYFVKTNGDNTNGNTSDANLYIFANPKEVDVPSKDDPNVTWFKPGVYAQKDYVLRSGATYYLEGGAFVYGRFYGNNVSNVTIKGRGVLCGENLTDMYDLGRTVCIGQNSKHITLEGINIMHPKVWTVAFYESSDIHIDNIHTISHGQSSDGCDIVGCQNVLVENSFFRGHDDMLAVKARDMQNNMSTPKDCEDVTFKNCVIWSDSSNPMTIGYETTQSVRNITYESIDVLSMSMPPVWQLEAVMAIEPHPYNGNIGGEVDGVTYKDIRVDLQVPQNSLFRFAVDGGGAIKNVTVQDVWVNYGGTLGGLIYGTSQSGVNNVKFINVRNNVGQYLSKDKVTSNEFVSDVIVSPTVDGGTQKDESWDISTDYSGWTTSQGGHNWYYKCINNGSPVNMRYNSASANFRPTDNASFPFIGYVRYDDPAYGVPYTYFPKYATLLHPATEGPACLVWKAPASGEIEIGGRIRRFSNAGDGIELKVSKNFNSQLSSTIIEMANNDFTNLETAHTAVQAGDEIFFSVYARSNNSYDSTFLIPVIKYISVR